MICVLNVTMKFWGKSVNRQREQQMHRCQRRKELDMYGDQTEPVWLEPGER